MVKHPGIVEIFDCGFTADGQAYLVMELLSGQPLHILLQAEGPLSIDRAVDLTRQIAGAVAAAHAQGIVHRDLKPDNIFVVPNRHAHTGENIKVLDFGVAKLAGASPTVTLGMLGTPLYMPPEQVASSEEVDGRADIYALGCMLFEMLCGRPPFLHDEPQAVAAMHVREQPPRARSLRPDVPFNVDSLIARTLAKAPGERPQSMADLRAELDVAWGMMQPMSTGEAPALEPVGLGPAVLGVRVSRQRTADGVVELVPVVDDPAATAVPRRGSESRRWLLVAGLLVLALALGALSWAW